MTRNWTASAALYRFFYWTGVMLAVVSLSLALARNVAALDSLWSPGIPWSWAAGIVAILGFIAAEVCAPVDETPGVPSPAGESVVIAKSAPSPEAIHQKV